MINFEFSDDQKRIREAVREFAAEKIAPRIREIEDGERIPDGVIGGLADLDLLGLTVSGKYGGLEADPVTVGLIAEELAAADMSCAVPTFYLVQAAWGYVLDKFGTPEAGEAILPKVTAGKSFLGIAATEPDTGSDLGNMKTAAKKDGGKYIINGSKLYISGVREIAEQMPAGGGYVLLAKTDRSAGTRGISMFYVPLKESEILEGVTTTYIDDWGRKGISTGGFMLDDLVIPESYLLGKENEGFKLAMEGFEFARAIISVICCGAAMKALKEGMDYLKMRKTFGRELARYQGIQFKLAEHWSKLEAARQLGYRALWMFGKEQRGNEYSRFDVSKACAEAKLFAVPTAFEAINEAIQWFGAFGYTEECLPELALKGIRSYYWAEGALEIMKTIVSRELLGKEYLVYK